MVKKPKKINGVIKKQVDKNDKNRRTARRYPRDNKEER